MKDINLEKLDSDELTTLKSKVEIALRDYDKRKRKEALAAVTAAARQHGFDLGELVEAQKLKGKSQSDPKYANPENPKKTWTGRGRQPDWFKKGLAAGKTPEDFLI